MFFAPNNFKIFIFFNFFFFVFLVFFDYDVELALFFVELFFLYVIVTVLRIQGRILALLIFLGYILLLKLLEFVFD